ncbi:MAG: CapA family protein [Erysipelotrichaceae bacterium]
MKKLLILVLSLLLVACSSSPKEEVKKPAPKDSVISFIGVGDNLIHDSIYKEADQLAGTEGDGTYDFTGMYEPVKDDIKKADLAFINQETILGGDDLGLSGYPTFNSPSVIASQLNQVGFDLVNTASNHALDKGMLGIENAKATWSKEKNMITAGTYTSNEDRNNIPVIKRKGVTFSFLAYTYGTNGVSLPNDYCVALFDDARITSDVQAAKEVSDVVIVSAHWGDENMNQTSEMQKHYAQLFADLKVDVVIGTHPHVIQPIEWVKGTTGNETLVVYSLGNFLSGMLDVGNVLGGEIKFDFVKNQKSKEIKVKNVKWIPLVTHYKGDPNNIMESRNNYKIYRLSDYSEEMAKTHGLNNYEGQSVKVDDLMERTKKVIDEKWMMD